MSSRTKGFLFALLAAFLYGLVPVLGKKFVSIYPPLFLAFIITITTDIFLTALVLIKKELFKNLFKKTTLWVILLGFFAALGSYFSFVGLTWGSASAAGFFFQFQAFFAAILAFIFLRETLSKYQILGLLIMLMGAYFFSSPFTLNLGNIFFLSAAFVWGINTVITRKIRKVSPFFQAFGRNTFSAIFLLPISYKYVFQNIGSVNPSNSPSFMLYGAVLAGFFIASYMSLRLIKAGESTSLQLISPLITLAIAFALLGERLTAMEVLGGALVLSGLYLIVKFK